MEQLKNKIEEYLRDNNIELLDLNIPDKDNTTFHLVINAEKDDLKKWEYFTRRVNEIITDKIYFSGNKNETHQNIRTAYNIMSGQYNDNKLTFNFDVSNLNLNPDSASYKCLLGFYEGLQKKYNTVCPKLDNLYIMCKVTHRCNLDCKYCYDKKHRQDINCDMSPELFDKILQLASKYTRNVVLTYHGGEPTVVGREWYEKIHEEIITKYPMLNMSFRMQSNGVVLNQEWFKMFEKYKIEIGISYNANYQEHLRIVSQMNDDQKKDKQVSDTVLEILKSDMFNIGVIDVVTKYNYKSMIETYEFYKSLKLAASLTPCYTSPDAEKNELELDTDEYIAEYKKFFKHWLYDKNGYPEVIAERLLIIATGTRHAQCEYNGCFTRPSFCIEPTGEVVLCGRHWPEEYYFGSILNYNNFEDAFKSDGYKLYRDETQSRMDNCKQTCEYYDLCHGGCTVRHIADTKKCNIISEEFCKLMKKQINATYEVLRDIDLIRDSLNPYAKRIMMQNGFYSVKEIKQILQEEGINIQIEYNPDDLIKCSEYQVFKGVNYEAVRTKYQRRIDIIDSLEDEIVERNLKARKRDLINYFADVAKSQNGE